MTNVKPAQRLSYRHNRRSPVYVMRRFPYDPAIATWLWPQAGSNMTETTKAPKPVVATAAATAAVEENSGDTRGPENNGAAVPDSGNASRASSPHPRWPATVLAIGAIIALAKWGQPFIVPVIVAILLFYALVAPVDVLERYRIPRAIGAAVVMIALMASTTAIAYAVWGQLDRIADAVPEAVSEVKSRWKEMKKDRGSTLSKIQGSAEAVQRAMSSDAPPSRILPATPATQAPGGVERFLWSGTLTALEMLSTLFAVYLLAYFLLLDGDQFRRRWVSFMGESMAPRRVTVQTLNTIDGSIRRYLAMLLITNAALGVITYLVLKIAGMNDAAGWGVLAALLHVIPYFGPLVVAIGVFVTALHQLGDVQTAAYAALATLAVATVIGTFAQTWMTARIARMNASLVFVSILFFSWLWGGIGLLLAVPIAVIIKVVLGATPSLRPISKLLGDGKKHG